MAWTGAFVLPWRALDLEGAAQGGSGTGGEVQHPRVPRRRAGDRIGSTAGARRSHGCVDRGRRRWALSGDGEVEALLEALRISRSLSGKETIEENECCIGRSTCWRRLRFW